MHPTVTFRNVKNYTILVVLSSMFLLLSTLFSLGGLPTHPQNPHSWRTSLSLLVERMDNTRLPKYALTYKPQGRRERGRPRKRWQRVDAGTGQTTLSMEEDDDDEVPCLAIGPLSFVIFINIALFLVTAFSSSVCVPRRALLAYQK
jgi:hypothetical protein